MDERGQGPAEDFAGRLDHSPEAGPVGQVRGDRVRGVRLPVGDFAGQALQVVLEDIHEDAAGAGGGQRPRGRRAEPPGGAGHDDPGAGERLPRRHPPSIPRSSQAVAKPR